MKKQIDQYKKRLQNMKKENLTIALLAVACTALVNVAGAATGIAGSAHDFSQANWNRADKDLCGPCHMVHGSDPNNQVIPLWSRDYLPAQDYQLFQSPHGTVTYQPRGASRACLSCHDGTVAYNQLKGQVPKGQTGVPVGGDYIIGKNHDLRGDHPISFDYQEAYNNSPTWPAKTLKAVNDHLTSDTLPAGNNMIGKEVKEAFLKSVNIGGTATIDTSVECTSCHDVHRSIGDSGVNSQGPIPTDGSPHNPLLVAYGTAGGSGSTLCRSCHIK
jgi:hypothetical protein